MVAHATRPATGASMTDLMMNHLAHESEASRGAGVGRAIERPTVRPENKLDDLLESKRHPRTRKPYVPNKTAGHRLARYLATQRPHLGLYQIVLKCRQFSA